MAGALGWTIVDTDDEIVENEGKPVAAIFLESGEAHFRQLERAQLAVVCRGERQVVSTGGGMVMEEDNRRLMEGNGVVICLDARPETIYERLQGQRLDGNGEPLRPMLAAPDPLARIRSLKADRQVAYSLAHWTVHTDHLTPEQVAQEVLRGWRALADRSSTEAVVDEGDLAAVVQTASGDYPVWVGLGILEEVGERVKRMMSPSAAYVISDEGVYSIARRVQIAMERAGIPAHLFLAEPGERSKTLDTANHIYRWLAGRKAERGHLVLAVGGGVVGDLAGFVAATYLRGIPFAQVTTSLLGMVDASIGGKVAVDLPQGKNMVGAFYQPRFVLADVQTLETLPKRQLASGWAEAIKYGLILDEPLLESLERERAEILDLEPEVATEVIRRCAAIKADVVSRDERETLGIRTVLNYGHTIGHAIEAATGYETFLHGEAVSVGMMGAAYIGQAVGLMSGDEVNRQQALLEAYGLPLDYGDADVAAVSEAMLSDKKTVGKAIHWVLLDGIGNAVTRSDVPAELVRETLERLAK